MSALTFLTKAASDGMTGADVALRDVRRQRAALNDIRRYAGAYTDAAIIELAAHGLRRSRGIRRTVRRREDD